MKLFHIFLVLVFGSVVLSVPSTSYETMTNYLKIYKTCLSSDEIAFCLMKKTIDLIDILESKGDLLLNENVKTVQAANSSVLENEEESINENFENVIDHKYLVAYEMLLRRIWKYLETSMIEISLPHVSREDILEIGK